MRDINFHEASQLGLGLSVTTTSPKVESVGPMPWVVQKFGGTSIGHFAFKIVKDVIL